jgi:hypothetical protein
MSATLLEPQVQTQSSILDYLKQVKYYNLAYDPQHPLVKERELNEVSFNLDEVLEALGLVNEEELWVKRMQIHSIQKRSFTHKFDTLTVSVGGFIYLVESITSSPLFAIKKYSPDFE